MTTDEINQTIYAPSFGLTKTAGAAIDEVVKFGRNAHEKIFDNLIYCVRGLYFLLRASMQNEIKRDAL
jgi:hypothetical protein